VVKNLSSPMPEWKAQTKLDRLGLCVSCLYVNDVITETERNRLYEVLGKKWKEEDGKVF